MKLFITIFTVFLFFFQNLNSQELDRFKYIIVPNQFEFTAGKDKYQLNSLTKFLFNKYGYTAFMEGDALPQDLLDDRCLAVRAEPRSVKGFLRTKIQFDMIDCNGITVMSSRVGESKEKDFKKGFNLAIRDAFVTFQMMEYKYMPSKGNSNKEPTQDKVVKSEEIEKLKLEVEALKKEKQVLESKKNNENKKTIEAVIDKPKTEGKTLNEQSSKVELLYAQPIDNGFQLVDTTPKKVMVLLKTPKADVFSVKDKNAIVYKENGKWFYSEVTDKGNITKELNIKF